MKSRSIFIIGTFSILSLVGFFIKNTQSVSEDDLRYLRQSEKENNQSYDGAAAFTKMIKADPATGQINPAYVIAAQKQLNMMSKSRADLVTWNFRGPDNIGGRSRILIVDNKDNNVLYAGGVSGGIANSSPCRPATPVAGSTWTWTGRCRTRKFGSTVRRWEVGPTATPPGAST